MDAHVSDDDVRPDRLRDRLPCLSDPSLGCWRQVPWPSRSWSRPVRREAQHRRTVEGPTRSSSFRSTACAGTTRPGLELRPSRACRRRAPPAAPSVRTAVYHWVFSYTPWHGLAATIRMPFSRETTDREKVDRIVEWLSLRDAQRPRLILSYLHGPDSAGHLEGPEAPAVMERVRQTDQLVERLLRALEGVPRSALVVVSDHGMTPVSRVLRTAEFLRDGAARRARAVSSGAVSNIYCPDAPSCDGAESALRRTTGVSVFRQEALPDDLRYRQPSRTGDLVAIAPAGAYFADGPNGIRPARGMHGYRPEEKSMQGIFRAWGAGVRRGSRSDSIRAVDVAPFVCRLLGIECPPGIDGRAPEELLAGADSGPASERGPTPSGSPVRRPPPRADRPVQGPRTPDYPPGGP
ncbi:MAG: hypothetical protein DMF52_06035 [Acidobacteria bacterium]|nr:MAG: hypothetical protein DMF52_06035 [Acidobacteriota bacterium]